MGIFAHLFLYALFEERMSWDLRYEYMTFSWLQDTESKYIFVPLAMKMMDTKCLRRLSEKKIWYDRAMWVQSVD